MASKSTNRMIGVVYLAYFMVAALSLALIQSQVRIGVAVSLLANVLYVVLTWLFYRLFKRTSQIASLVALSASIIGAVIQSVAYLFLLRMDQNHYRQLYELGLVFFGLFDIALGYLLIKSRAVPRWLGYLMVVAGIGWLTFALPGKHPISLAVQAVGGISEVLLMLWLLIKGARQPE